MKINESLMGAVFGAVGGAAGTFLMSYYWKAASALHGHDPRLQTRDGGPHALDEISVVGQQAEEGEASTEAVGRMLHEATTGAEPSEKMKNRLSEGVHWSYGVIVSALYGAIRGRKRMPDATGGLVFGTALWAFGDELMVPLLGLSKGPTAYPVEQHAHRLGVHLFYGIIAAATTQGLFRAFAPAPKKREIMWDAVKTYATVKGVRSALGALSHTGSRRSMRGLKRAARNTRNAAMGMVNGQPKKATRLMRATKKSADRAIGRLTSS